MKSAQVGATELLNNVVGYFIDQDPSPILVLQPTISMSQAWSKDRLAPMLRDTPALHGVVNDPKARNSGNTLLHKTFPGGHITIAGANSPAGLASRPIRVLLADEISRYPVSAGTEGDPVNLARVRTKTFWNRKILMTSTPTVKGACRVEMEFEESDKRYFFIPCPHCKHSQRLVWSNVQWPKGEPEKAKYCCEECGSLFKRCSKAGGDPKGRVEGKPVHLMAGLASTLTRFTPRGQPCLKWREASLRRRSHQKRCRRLSTRHWGKPGKTRERQSTTPD